MSTNPSLLARFRAWLQQHPEIAVTLLLVAVARLLPHPWNFTPVGAAALLAGATVDRRAAFTIALVPLFLTDLLVGFYNPLVMAFVYGSFLLYVLIGRFFLNERKNGWRLGGAVLAGSMQFFVLTNFAVWAAGMYGYTWQGLVQCYVMAIPYYGNTLAADAFYGVVLFTAFHLVQRWIPLRPVATPA